MNAGIQDILKQSFRTEYVQADVSPLPTGHSTGWRTMPFFMYSQAGSGSEIISLEAGTRWQAEEGDLIVLPAGVRHKVDVASPRERRQWAHVNYFVYGNIDLFSMLDIPVLIRGSIGQRVGKAIAGWVADVPHRGGHPLAGVVAQHEFALRLLAMVAPLCHLRADASERLDGLQRLNPVIRHMEQNLDQPMNRDDLARMSGLSPAQFHVVFRSIMKVSPVAYLRALRVRHAQRLLIMTADPVKDVAIRSGYPDPFVFCKSFKRACGHSPTEYRESALLS